MAFPGQSVVLQAIDRSFQDIIVEGFFAGLYTAAFFATLFGLFRRLSRGPSTIYMMMVTLTMFSLSLLHLGAHWYFARIAYVRDNTGPDGIFMALHSQTFAGRMTGSVAFALNILIADCLFVWRCWIVWGRNWKIVLIPILTTVVGTVFSGLNLANQSETLGPNFIDTATPFLGLSVATTLLVTLFIAFRIYRVSHQLKKHAGGAILTYSGPTYSGVIEIIVESALLNSSALLILLILVVRKDNNYVYAQNIVAQISGIAPTLIIARISLDLARSSQTWVIRSDVLNQVETSLVFSSATDNIERDLNISSSDGFHEDIEMRAGSSDNVGDIVTNDQGDTSIQQNGRM